MLLISESLSWNFMSVSPGHHSDGGFTNIMMDATSMFGPDSFHPDQIDLKYDFSSRARYRSRTERPPKYYFIDFGLSILFKPNELPATVLAFEGGRQISSRIPRR